MAKPVKPKLLLTGGSGMVGRSILAHPKACEWSILSPTSSELNLMEADAVASYINSNKPDFVLHAAGKVGGIQANLTNPVGFLDINSTIGRNVVMAAYDAGVPCFLNLASSCMYPKEAISPLTEDMILSGYLEPTNEGYALAKIMTTKLCEYITRSTSKQYRTLVPCNLYGPYDNSSYGTFHLVPAIIAKVHAAKMAKSETIEICGDGTARREFMYSGDFATAVWKALNDVDKLPAIMNIGVGNDRSVNDYYNTVASVLSWSGAFLHDMTKPVGMRQKLCSVEKQKNWGWSPTTTPEAGIEATYNYYVTEVMKNV